MLQHVIGKPIKRFQPRGFTKSTSSLLQRKDIKSKCTREEKLSEGHLYAGTTHMVAIIGSRCTAKMRKRIILFVINLLLSACGKFQIELFNHGTVSFCKDDWVYVQNIMSYSIQ